MNYFGICRYRQCFTSAVLYSLVGVEKSGKQQPKNSLKAEWLYKHLNHKYFWSKTES